MSDSGMGLVGRNSTALEGQYPSPPGVAYPPPAPPHTTQTQTHSAYTPVAPRAAYGNEYQAQRLD